MPEPNIEELKKEDPIEAMRAVLGWGQSLINENRILKAELERLKDNKFNWYEEQNLVPIPEDTPDEKKIKILTWRLREAKKANKQLKQSTNAKIKEMEKETDKWINKYRQATKFEYDGSSFEGLLYFAHNLRTYILSGLKHMKSCSKCLDKTCPRDIEIVKDENGEYVEKLKEETRKEWGSIISKMIRALELRGKYENRLYAMNEKEKKEVDEGFSLILKYHDSFFY